MLSSQVGNCGDGGKGGSTWYLMCKSCRTKYLNDKLKGDESPELPTGDPAPAAKKLDLQGPAPPNDKSLVDIVLARLEEKAALLLRLDASAVAEADNTRHVNDADARFEPVPSSAYSQLLAFHDPTTLDLLVGDSNLRAISVDETASRRPKILRRQDTIAAPSARPVVSIATPPRTKSIGSHTPRPGLSRALSMPHPQDSPGGNLQAPTIQVDPILLSRPSRNLRAMCKREGEHPLVEQFTSLMLSTLPTKAVEEVLGQGIEALLYRLQGLTDFVILLRNVSSVDALHDILWAFVGALSHASEPAADGRDNGDELALPVGSHPLDGIDLRNSLGHSIMTVYYKFLLSVMDVMKALPVEHPLQALALRCWSVDFKPTDSPFLQRSKVFALISDMIGNLHKVTTSSRSVTPHEDLCVRSVALLPVADLVQVGSREALLASLSDGTTETFWESDDGPDKKWIQYTAGDTAAEVVALHLDAGRDSNTSVNSIEAVGGPDEDHLDTKLGTFAVAGKFVGWKMVSCIGSDGHLCKVVRLSLKSSHSKVRVRQLAAFHSAEGMEGGLALGELTKLRANEALQLFRQLSMKLFGFKRAEAIPEADKDEPGQGDGDSQLRQQVVGLLFNKDSQLSLLQARVCNHFFAEISKQTCVLVEHSDDSFDDDYLHELVGMVASLAASDAGIEKIASEQALINDLVCLLHLSSSRVQAGAIAIIRRLLLVVQPAALAGRLVKLPVADAGEGMIPLLILAVAKALDVQVRVRGQGKTVTKTSFETAVPIPSADGLARWYRGKPSSDSAHSIINLLADALHDKFGVEWQGNTRSIIMNLVESLSVLENESEMLASCINKPGVWLALGALAAMNKELVDKLSQEPTDEPNSGPRSFCDNHDDSSTLASFRCSECDLSLCGDCDSFLHLSRRARGHSRLKLASAESKSLVELNEGCGRVRLPLLLAIADRRSLQGVIEIKAASTATGSCCRFCEGPLTDDGGVAQAMVTGISSVCASKECIELAKQCCDKTLPCTHACCGIRGEPLCLPCLRGCDNEASDKPLTQDHEDQCMICFTGALPEEPCIQVKSVDRAFLLLFCLFELVLD